MILVADSGSTKTTWAGSCGGVGEENVYVVMIPSMNYVWGGV